MIDSHRGHSWRSALSVMRLMMLLFDVCLDAAFVGRLERDKRELWELMYNARGMF